MAQKRPFRAFVFGVLSKLFAMFGLQFVSRRHFATLTPQSKLAELLELSSFFSRSMASEIATISSTSRSQSHQELVAAAISGFKSNGYFVEIGAADGVYFSNTWALEGILNWGGVLVEANPKWWAALERNRSCVKIRKAAWSSSGEIVNLKLDGLFSTIDQFNPLRMSLGRKSRARMRSLETVSLNDLLELYSDDRIIDFLSIDTEGAEFEILRGVDFEKYSFGFVCVEHNYTDMRTQIFDLLTRNGYVRILQEYSKWDDWYVPQTSKYSNL